MGSFTFLHVPSPETVRTCVVSLIHVLYPCNMTWEGGIVEVLRVPQEHDVFLALVGES